MITVKIVGLNYTVNQFFFDCPVCGDEQEYIRVSPYLCKKCKKPMPLISEFFAEDPVNRMKHMIKWHYHDSNTPKEKTDALRV